MTLAFLSYLRSKWFRKQAGCHGNQLSGSGVVTMATLQGPFYMAAVGLLVSAVAALVEHLLIYVRRKHLLN